MGKACQVRMSMNCKVVYSHFLNDFRFRFCCEPGIRNVPTDNGLQEWGLSHCSLLFTASVGRFCEKLVATVASDFSGIRTRIFIFQGTFKGGTKYVTVTTEIWACQQSLDYQKAGLSNSRSEPAP